MQLGVQCLILRENGYHCDSGVIYYRKTKQRVPLLLTADLEAWILETVGAARACAAGPIPPPLIDSPKCVRCSLAPVCLPDETHFLATGVPENDPLQPQPKEVTGEEEASPPAKTAPRRLLSPRDDKRALYLNTQGYRVTCQSAVLRVKDKDRVVAEVRLMDVSHVALFGNIQVSTQAIQRLCQTDTPVTWFSMGGWFYGITRGHSLKNVLLRIEQFKRASDPVGCLRLARQFVRGKIHNHRVFFMRNHRAPPSHVKLRLGHARTDALAAASLGELLGIEGAAAALYFEHFHGMIRVEPEEDDFLEGVDPPPRVEGVGSHFNFNFTLVSN